jgi:hypothetical protein
VEGVVWKEVGQLHRSLHSPGSQVLLQGLACFTCTLSFPNQKEQVNLWVCHQ